MSQSTIREFAEQAGVALDRLLLQLREAGVVSDDPDAEFSEADKAALLEHLRRADGRREDTSEEGGPSQITLKRRSHSELRMPSGGGERRAARGPRAPAGRTVSVEVRKKRTYVKRSVVEAEAAEQEVPLIERALQKDLQAAAEARRVAEEAEAARAEALKAEQEAAAAEAQGQAESAEPAEDHP